ncbi:MAG: hypothetical protein HRT47_01805 [Candidatus Caenarcaniphilales bacterium]|nr:hypothetical protein [Candidatus Caenarcaniphilales bacterium]
MKITPNKLYSNYLVVYFDVLGWKDLTLNSPLACSFVSNRINGLRYKLKSRSIFSREKVISFFFSDSVILTLELPMDNENNLEKQKIIFYQIAELQSELFENWGVLLRGFITIGECFIDPFEHVCFGPAINKSVLKEKLICFPKIVLDKDHFPDKLMVNNSRQNSVQINRKDSWWNKKAHRGECYEEFKEIQESFFLDYIKVQKNSLDRYVGGFNQVNNFRTSFRSKLNKQITNDVTMQNEKLSLKYIWLTKYYDKCFRKNSFHLDYKNFTKSN